MDANSIRINQPAAVLDTKLHIGQLVGAMPVWLTVLRQILLIADGAVTQDEIMISVGLRYAHPMYSVCIAIESVGVSRPLALRGKETCVIGVQCVPQNNVLDG